MIDSKNAVEAGGTCHIFCGICFTILVLSRLDDANKVSPHIKSGILSFPRPSNTGGYKYITRNIAAKPLHAYMSKYIDSYIGYE